MKGLNEVRDSFEVLLCVGINLWGRKRTSKLYHLKESTFFFGSVGVITEPYRGKTIKTKKKKKIIDLDVKGSIGLENILSHLLEKNVTKKI